MKLSNPLHSGRSRAKPHCMKLTGLEVFDLTIQRTNSWLKELMQELNWSDRRKTYLAFRCTLHALRDHMPVNEAVFLGEQLPMLLRGSYFEHWNPQGKPQEPSSRADFLSTLSSYLERDGEFTPGAEALMRAVFRFLERKVADGEIEDVRSVMPRMLNDLWPRDLRAA
jgi:uncharacterized protein (DUF2267 family)